MPARDRLAWYSERFAAVEVNATFYAVPQERTVARWAEITPKGFTFDVKLHRLLSRHSAQLDSLPPDLREGAETNSRGRVRLTPALEEAVAERVLAAVGPLERTGKLGAFLLQLTPAFAPGKNRIDELAPLAGLLAPHRLAVELRHRGWVEGERAAETLDALSQIGAAFVSVDAPRAEHVPIMPSLDAVTHDGLAYMRMHGRNEHGYMTGKTVAERFGWVYSDDELAEIARRIQALAEQAGEVHVMFNNNRDDDAPTAARRFRSLLGQDPGPPAASPQLRLR